MTCLLLCSSCLFVLQIILAVSKAYIPYTWRGGGHLRRPVNCKCLSVVPYKSSEALYHCINNTRFEDVGMHTISDVHQINLFTLITTVPLLFEGYQASLYKYNNNIIMIVYNNYKH